MKDCVFYIFNNFSLVFTDTSELKLINNTFEMAKSIAELKITESELALYSASVLLSPGKYKHKHLLLVC